MIKILSFCAALLAPESTGLDPHGRALHLELHADFNTSYEKIGLELPDVNGTDPECLFAIINP